jgi:hypothetical protein
MVACDECSSLLLNGVNFDKKEFYNTGQCWNGWIKREKEREGERGREREIERDGGGKGLKETK